MSIILLVLLALVSVTESLRFQSPRFLSQRTSLAASLAGKEITKLPSPRDLEPILVSSPRDLIAIDDENFTDVISAPGLQVVLFTASWCGPCRGMKMSLENIKSTPSHSKLAGFYEIDTDFNPDSAADMMVRSIPSTLFFKDGKLVSEIVGAVPAHVITSQLEKYGEM
jgi:thioredoxin 1